MAALHFKNLAEVHARPAFDPSFVVTIENYRGVVGDTSFSDLENGTCQLHRPGRLCVAQFQRGWLVHAVNDESYVEALIGPVCAKNYFRNFAQFKLDVARHERALELQDLQQRRAAILNDADYQRRLRDCQYKLQRYDRELQDLSIPPTIRRKLTSMGRSGRGSVDVLVRYVEDEDDKGNEIVSWRPFAAEEIEGVSVWSQSTASLHSDVAATVKAFEGAAAAESEPLHRLRTRVRRLEGLRELARQVDELHARLRTFTAPANLARVALLSSSQLDQSVVAEMALQRWRKPTGRREVQGLLDEMMAGLREQYGGRAVRIDA